MSRSMIPVVALMLAAAPAVAAHAQADAHRNTDRGITIRDAWVRMSTPLRTSSSGYCRIENATDKAIALVGVTAAGVGEAQVHAMASHDGQMQMHPVATLRIPPGGAVDLAPGGTHVMLTGIRRPLAVGTTLEMQFTFDDGRTRTVRAIVRPFDAMTVR